LIQWHDPDILARVVATVYLNDEAKIPSSIKVNVGLPQKGRSWTVPCYVLKRQGVAELHDEDAYVMVPSSSPTLELPRWRNPNQAGKSLARSGLEPTLVSEGVNQDDRWRE